MASRLTLLLLFIFLFGLTYLVTPVSAQAATTYYFDCNGNDGASSNSISTPWKSITKANAVSLAAGDTMLFKTDCSWDGSLKLTKSGTSSQNILVSSYGTGAAPIIKSNQTFRHAIILSGSHVTIEKLRLVGTPPSTITNCKSGETTGMGEVYGIQFTSSATYNTVKDLTIEGFSYGMTIHESSHHNKITNSSFIKNNVMILNDSSGGSNGNDYGAMGIHIKGDDNEIANNTFVDHDACSFDYTRDGSAVEIYGGKRNNVHHNISRENDVFTELGNSRSADNVFAYNLVTSSLNQAKFLVTRGANSGLGPIYGTKAYNNTVYLTGSSSVGVACSLGCNASVLVSKNNIIWANQGGWGDATYNEGNNIYWRADGKPYTTPSGVIGSSSIKANPFFTAASTLSSGDFSLTSASVDAIDKGVMEAFNAGFKTDLEGKSVPINSAIDIGAYEYGAVVTSPTPSVTPVPTPSPSVSPSVAPSVSPTPGASPTACQNADINQDGTVNIFDYSILVQNFFSTSPNPASADINKDGVVNIFDYSLLVGSFFEDSGC